MPAEPPTPACPGDRNPGVPGFETEVRGISNGSYPVRVDLRAPNKVANWRPLVHWLLVIPHLLIVYGLRVLRYALTIIAFFTVLFTKQIPDSIFNVIVMTRRYTWRAVSYGAWLRESYPPFI